MDKHPHSEDELLAHAAWVQRVVRAMVRDEHLADDLVQDALEAGLRTGPENIRNPRTWLLGVVRNLHGKEARSNSRRRSTEDRKPAPGDAPTSEELLARLEVQQIVAKAIMDLPDPFRSVLILRYYENAPVRKIAAAHGVDRRRVETQIRRGHELLRKGLKGRLGKAWVVAVFPLAIPAAATAATTVGLTLAARPILTAAGILLGLVGVTWVANNVGDEPEQQSVAGEMVALDSAQGALDTEPGEVQPMVEEVERFSMTAPPEPDGPFVVEGTIKIDGVPVPGQEAVLEIQDGFDWELPVRESILLTAGAGGRFRWSTVLQSGPVQLRLRAPDGAEVGGRSSAAVIRRGAVPEEDLDVDLYRFDLTVRGVVRDLLGIPLQGARVFSIYGETVTDEQGRWSLPETSKSRGPRGAVYGLASGKAQVQAWYSRDELDREVEIRLPGEVVVEGRVLDEAGRGIPGVRLIGGGARGPESVSGADGRFRLDHLLESRPGEIFVDFRKSGFEDGFVRTKSVYPGQVVERDVTLRRAASVSGTVFGPDGTPREGVELILGWDRNGSNNRRAYSDRNGAFAFPTAPPGDLKLFSRNDGLAPVKIQLGSLEPGSAHPGTDVHLGDGRTISVLVTDLDGDPLEGATARAAYTKYESTMIYEHADADGKAQLEHVPEIAMVIHVQAEGFTPQDIPLAVGRRELHARLVGGGVLEGVVTDAETGEPIPAFTVRLDTPQLSSGEEASRKPSGAHEGLPFESESGEWRIDEDLTVGGLTRLEVSAPGYARFIEPRAVVTAAGSAEPRWIAMQREARIVGVVVGADGNPVNEARIAALLEGDVAQRRIREEAYPRAVSDSEGRFEVGGLPGGEVRLLVRHRDWVRELHGPVEVRPGGAAEVIVTMSPGGMLKGQVLDPSGEAVVGARMWASLHGGLGHVDRHESAFTDRDGRYAIRHLVPGRYHVQVTIDPEGRSWRMYGRDDVFVEEGENELDFFAEGGATIAGTVVGAIPDDGVSVTARRSTMSGEESVDRTWGVDVIDGAFRLSGLPAGRYFVYVERRWMPDGTFVGADGVSVTVGEDGAVTVDLLLKVVARQR